MSELRENPSSGDWVVIASSRNARPASWAAKKKARTPAPKATCPFEDLKKSGNWPPIIARPSARNWRIVAVENKYPALTHKAACSQLFRHGMYRARTGVGAHELVITRDHNKNFAALSPAAALEVFRIFQERIRKMNEDPCLVYAVPFMNYGPKAGASLWHPHYQIFAIPTIPPHSARSISGAARYFKSHRRCVRCDMVKEERSERTRVIAENAHAIAVAPYASKVPFEAMILTKRHYPYFHKTPEAALRGVVSLLQSVMARLRKYVNDPDMNFFVHEAPLDGKRYDYHHWHVEVLPRISIPAGVEFSTGIYVDSVAPEAAAAILRGEARAGNRYH